MAEKQVVDYILNVQVAGAKRDLDKMAAAAGTASKEVDELGDESKQSAKDVDKLGKESKKAGKDIIGAFSKAANIVTGLQSAFSLAGQSFNVLNDALRAGFEVTRETVDNINQLNDATARSGLSAGGVQAIIQAFEGAGMSAQTAEAFITRLPKQLNDLSNSSSRAAQAYTILGGSVRDANGDLKDTDTLLREMTQIFQAMEDPGQRANAVYEILGRSAGSFLQAFGQTAEFEKFLGFTEEFGVKTGKEASNQAAVFQEALAAITIQSKGLMQQMLSTIGGMSKFNDGMIAVIRTMGFFQGFLEAGQEGIRAFGNDLITAAKTGLAVFAVAVGSVVAPILAAAAALDFLQSKVTGSEGGFTVLAGKLKEAAISHYELSDAFAEGAQKANEAETAFQKIIGGLEKDQEEIDAMNKKLKELFDQLGETGEEAAETAKDMGKLSDAIEDFFQVSTGEQLGADMFREASESLANIQAQLRASTDPMDQIRDSAEAFKTEMQRIHDLAVEGLGDRGFTALLDFQQRMDDTTREFESATTMAIKRLEVQASVAFAENAANSFLNVLNAGAAGVFQRAAEVFGGVVAMEISAARGDGAEMQLLRGEGGAQIAGIIASTVLSVGGFLADLGRKSEAQLRDEAENTARAVAKGVQVLPALLIDILPDAIRIGFDELLIAIRELPTRIALAFVERVSISVFGGNGGGNGGGDAGEFGLLEGIQAATDQVGRRIQELFGGGMMNGGPFIPSAANGIRFTGAQRGLAMLHEGETVIPRSGRQSQATARNMAGLGGNGITVNINAAVVDGNAVDALVREMENRFRTFGQGTSPLFAG